MTSIETQALRCLALDQIAAWRGVLDLVGGRPTTPEERDAIADSEASDYHAGVECAHEDRVTAG